ncbi:MAG: hypothetical protein WCC55_07125, partial [Nitrosotalea sp.]
MTISNPQGLWIKPIPMKRIQNEQRWAEIRIQYENESDLTSGYFDILIGKKNEKGHHIHLIKGLDGKTIERTSRNLLQSFTQKIESKLHGKLAEETFIAKIGNPPISPVDIAIG